MSQDASDYYKGKANPNALVNLTPSIMASRIAAIPDEILCMSDDDLQAHNAVVEIDDKLRASFQIELERVMRTGDKMVLTHVYKGIITYPSFNELLNNSYRLALIIRPYREYQAQLEELLQLGFDRMSEIMRKDPDAGSKYDHKLAALQMQLWKELADRRRGSAAKKIEIDSKTMNLNLTKDISNPPRNIEDIDKKLKELESQNVINVYGVSDEPPTGF